MIHRKLHKKACKEHTAELKDEKLYNQGNEMKFCPLYLSTCNPMPINVWEFEVPSSVARRWLRLAAIKGGLDKAHPLCRTSPPARKQ